MVPILVKNLAIHLPLDPSLAFPGHVSCAFDPFRVTHCVFLSNQTSVFVLSLGTGNNAPHLSLSTEIRPRLRAKRMTSAWWRKRILCDNDNAPLYAT